MEANQRGAIHLPEGEGHSVWLAGELYTAKAVGQQTGGRSRSSRQRPRGGADHHLTFTTERTRSSTY